MMTMKYSMCILVLTAGMTISISESISSGHNREGTESDLKRDECNRDSEVDCEHVPECQNNSDCHHCSHHQKPYCSQGQCHCRDCLDHLDCLHKDCLFNQTFHCSSCGHCHCEGRQCIYNSDCYRRHHCNTGQTHLCSYGRCSCRDHCDHVCLLTGKYNYLTTHTATSMANHGCECLPKDYCDHRYSCTPTDVVCSHNETIRCNGNNKCECYCSQDSQCNNCPSGTLGFCVNERCVCDFNNYCPGGNKFYCLKNFQCAHNESKRCNQNDRCECFCEIDTDCKTCPEKGFCVDGSCVCESQDYCPKGYPMYCLDRRCDRGYTSKCNSTNHCYCAHVPNTCSNHDVSKCYHLTCSAGEKKYCEGRTCTCKPLDYCQQNDADCQHKTCDASKGEVKMCLSGTCGCLAISDLCSGDDTNTCQHTICNQYQVKKCENGMCICQDNPSKAPSTTSAATCASRIDCNQQNTRATFLTFTMPCPGDHIDCVDNECFCSIDKITSRAAGTTTQKVSPTTASQTSVGTTASTTHTTPLSTSHPTLTTTTSTAEAPSTTSVTTCASIMDCNQQNTYATFLTFAMPCPVHHIDCVNNKCFCSIDKITTSRAIGTTTQKVSPTTASQTSAGSTASTTHTTPLSTSHPTLTTTTSTGLMCPECDENLICSWTRDCYPGEVCMIRQFNRTLTVHCSEKDDCNFMKKFVPEILCCKDIQCINHIII